MQYRCVYAYKITKQNQIDQNRNLLYHYKRLLYRKPIHKKRTTMNKILFLSGKTNQNGNTFFEQTKAQLNSCENQYLKFDFQSSDFCDTDVLEKAKTANAILFFATNKQEELVADSVRKSLGLYAQITTLSRNIDNVNHSFCIVQDKNGGIYEGEKGFANNSSFGREAYDVERYSELEIERTARIAYDVANNSRRALTLADKADKLTSSKLWRKIVADVNEDYPFTCVDMQDVTDVLNAIIKKPTTLDVVLSTSLFGDLLASAAKAVSDYTPSISFVGDTPLAMYGFCTSDLSTISQPSVTSLISFLLKNSFGIE